MTPRVMRRPDGLRWQAVPRPFGEGVSAAVWVQFGAADEHRWLADGVPADIPVGSAHFLEHLLHREVGEHRTVTLSGCEYWASTGMAGTCYRFTFSDKWQAPMQAILDILMHPNMQQTRIDSERAVIEREIAGRVHTPTVVGEQALREALFGAHAAAGDPAGTRVAIHALTLDQLRQTHQLFYRPERITVGLAGDIEQAEAADFFGRLPEAAAASPVMASPAPREAEYPPRYVSLPGNCPYGYVGFRRLGLDLHGQARIRRTVAAELTLRLLALTLRGGTVDESGYSQGKDYEYLHFRTDQAGLAKLIQGLLSAGLRNHGLSVEPQLDRAKRWWLSQISRIHADLAQLARSSAWLACHDCSLGEYSEFAHAVAVNDVADLVTELIVPGRMGIASPADPRAVWAEDSTADSNSRERSDLGEEGVSAPLHGHGDRV